MSNLRIVSFNVRMDVLTEGTELKPISKNRVQAVCEQVIDYAPDLVGFQEDTNNWVNNMSLGDGYACYRPDAVHEKGTVEYCSIYVKKGITVTDKGWHWLTSDGTNTAVALTYDGLVCSGRMTAEELASLGHYKGSDLKRNCLEKKDKNSLASRLMNYVVLDIGGEKVIYVNTHLQHRGHNMNSYESASDVYKTLYKLRFLERCAQMKMLEKSVEVLKMRYGTDKVIMTADFNDQPDGFDYGTGGDNFYLTVTKSGWNDSALAAKKTVDTDTWNNAFCAKDISFQGQGYTASNGSGGSWGRIDYCFVSNALKSSVEEYRVGDYEYTTSNGVHVYPSDHLPIIIDIAV